MNPILVILVFVAAIAVIAILAARARAKRRQDLATLAKQRGLRFTAGNVRVEHRFPEFDCLRQGQNRYAYNLLEGEWSGRETCAFDYHYETHSHDSKGRRQTHHHHFSAVVVASEVPLQPLAIRPEGLFDKVAGFFGFDDIDFESDEFSRAFHVKAADRKWAYDVIHARTMEHLLRMPRFRMEFSPGRVIAWRTGRFSVVEFIAAAETVRGVLDRLPEYVVRRQQGEG